MVDCPSLTSFHFLPQWFVAGGLYNWCKQGGDLFTMQGSVPTDCNLLDTLKIKTMSSAERALKDVILRKFHLAIFSVLMNSLTADTFFTVRCSFKFGSSNCVWRTSKPD